MKNAIIICFLFLTVSSLNVKGQDNRFTFQSDASVGLLPIKLSGTIDKGDYGTPVYKSFDTSALVINLIGHVGTSIAILQEKTWSAGVKLNVGFGFQGGLVAAEGLTSYVLDFPQYIYYRNHKSFDYSVMLGYKYTRAALPYHLALAAFDINIDDKKSVRLYGSLFRYKYYTLYTNGTLEPAVKIGEFGVVYIYNF